MNKINQICDNILEESLKDPNCNHPIQKSKILINDLIYRLSVHNPDLPVETLNNKTLTDIIDILLEFGVYGSVTDHWIKPGGKRQDSHIDYPHHLHSSTFGMVI